MKVTVIVACAVLAMIVLGWLSFSNQGSSASINLETEKIKQDTHEALEHGEKAIKEVGRQSEKLIHGDK